MNNHARRLAAWGSIGVVTALAVRAAIRWKRTIDLKGKTVVITGGSRGLGLALARELAKEGMKIAICARDQDEVERARKHLSASGAEVIARVCDVAEAEEISAFIQEVLQRFGTVDLLINNAGVIQVGPVEVMTPADFDLTMRIHFWGPLQAMLAVLPSMRARGFGRIANISSVGGKISVPHLLPYCASKFALVGLSEGMRGELLKDGIHVTTVVPGLMRTGSHVNAIFKGRHRTEYTLFSISDSIPLLTTSAESAARQIIAAVRRGDAEVVVGLPARMMTWLHGVCPGLIADLNGILNSLLPGPGGIQTQARSGQESVSWISPSILTKLSDDAAGRNNEIAPYFQNDRVVT